MPQATALSCGDLASHLGLEQADPQSKTNLCTLKGGPKILAICGETLNAYEVLTYQADGYTLLPSWNSLDAAKLKTACVNLPNMTAEEIGSCGVATIEFQSSFKGIDRDYLQEGATIVVATYESGKIETKSFNWKLGSIEKISFQTNPDQVYSDDVRKPCLYSNETDFSSIAFPILHVK